MLVGLVSDTHGFVDERLLAALRGVDVILHAGDVGAAHVIEALGELAPVHAVQGNNDAKLAGLGLPERLDVTLDGFEFHLVHQLADARPGPETDVIVYGHSHRPSVETRDGRLYVNPGAAGRVGFHPVQTVALLDASGGEISVRTVTLGRRLGPPGAGGASRQDPSHAASTRTAYRPQSRHM